VSAIQELAGIRSAAERLGIEMSVETPTELAFMCPLGNGRGLACFRIDDGGVLNVRCDGCKRQGRDPRAILDTLGANSDGAASRAQSAVFALTLDRFIEERSSFPTALVGDVDGDVLIPAAGLALIFAKGGRGKTTLIVDLAFHGASGIDWLGITIARPLRVLFIENEGPREPFRAKLERKRDAWPHQIRGALLVHSRTWGAFTLGDPEQATHLRACIEKERIDLVIGDPLDSLGLAGVGSPEDTRNLMLLLAQAGLFRDCAFLLLAHPRKAEASDELDEIAGAWGGRPDTMLRLARLPGNRARLSFPKLRWSRSSDHAAYILAFEPADESFALVHVEQAKEDDRDYLAEVTALLGDSKWRTVRELAVPKKDGGIGTSDARVKELLDAHEERFVSCRGDAVGRSATATCWQLRRPESRSSQLSLPGGEEATATTATPCKGSQSQSQLQSPVTDALGADLGDGADGRAQAASHYEQEGGLE
jgi:hypothetical protein